MTRPTESIADLVLRERERSNTLAEQILARAEQNDERAAALEREAAALRVESKTLRNAIVALEVSESS